jgi:hypothetical protein
MPNKRIKPARIAFSTRKSAMLFARGVFAAFGWSSATDVGGIDMKTLAVVAFSLAATFVTHSLSAADNIDRPVGVEARYWIPISERLGFVVLPPKKQFPPVVAQGAQGTSSLIPSPETVSAELMPPEKGYFVLKTPTGWRRLVVTDASDLTG